MCKKSTTTAALKTYVVVEVLLVSAAAVLSVVEQYRFGHHYANSIMPYIGNLFEVAGIMAFASIAVHLAWQRRLRWKQRCFTTLAMVALYFSSYSLLSVNGQYHASRSGRHRWNSTGLSVVDRGLWHAKGVFWQPFQDVSGKHTYQATYLGYFYSPLIVLDRRFVHRTTTIMEGQ